MTEKAVRGGIETLPGNEYTSRIGMTIGDIALAATELRHAMETYDNNTISQLFDLEERQDLRAAYYACIKTLIRYTKNE